MIAASGRALALVLLGPGIALAQIPISPVPGAFRDLDFGTVLPGVSRFVAPSDPGAGLWVFHGEPLSTVSVTFTALPAALETGTNVLAVTFGSVSAAWNTVNDPATAQSFDPAVGTIAALGRPPSRVYVWLGGVALPASSQPAGVYSATYTLDVSYASP